MKEGHVTEQMRSALNKMVRTEEALEKKKVHLTFSQKSSEQWTMVEAETQREIVQLPLEQQHFCNFHN